MFYSSFIIDYDIYNVYLETFANNVWFELFRYRFY